MIGTRRVLAVHDRQDPSGPFGPIRSETDRASRDVLVFELEGEARVVLRPSGTEPKNKVYVEVAGTPTQSASDVQRASRDLAEEFVLAMLGRVGFELPRWALSISDLVSVEHKQDFALEVVPALQTRLDTIHPDNSPPSPLGWTNACTLRNRCRALVQDGARPGSRPSGRLRRPCGPSSGTEPPDDQLRLPRQHLPLPDRGGRIPPKGRRPA